MSACETCLQRLHYIRYLESKIRVLEFRRKVDKLLSDSSDSSDDSSSSTEDIHGQISDIKPNRIRDTITNSNNRRVIEIQESPCGDERKTEINKIRELGKRKRKQ